MLKKLFQQVIRFFARLFSSHSKPFEFPKGSKKPPIRPIIFVPGSSASIQRFNGTIRMLHRFSRKKQSLLKIKVNKGKKTSQSLRDSLGLNNCCRLINHFCCRLSRHQDIFVVWQDNDVARIQLFNRFDKVFC